MKVTVRESSMVKPVADTPSGSLWLSNLDLLMPPHYHTHVLYFYRFNAGALNFFDPAALKAALGRALLHFYPYAGRLMRDGDNRLQIECNADGVLFVEAHCDATLDDLGDFVISTPDLPLIPAVDYSKGISAFPLLLLQLTRFKCGGVCLGFASEHHVADGQSALHFMNSWSDIARGLTVAVPPLFDRTILSARNPPHPKFPHIEYQPPPPLKAPLHNSETAFSMFKLTRDQFEALKVECREDEAGNKLNYTSYEVLTGHVWRSVCGARRLPYDQETKLHIPVSGRSKLQPPVPVGFFGNVLFSATPVALCGELVSKPLRFTVDKIHKAIGRMGDEYMRSAIDHLELYGDACIPNTSGASAVKSPNFRVVSWVGLPFYNADFGWGKPAYIGPGAAPHEGKSYALSGPTNDGSFYIAITLHKHHINLFEKLLYKGIHFSNL